MTRNIFWAAFVALVIFGSAFSIQAQRRAKLGRVCGDPTATCKGRDNFQAADLPFETGKAFVLVESEWFYGIVLKSVKLPDYGDCEHPSFLEPERSEIQELFPNNKVFMQNCVESASNYYNGVSQKSAFIAVYAGKTLTAANAFLKKVQGAKRFPGIKVRRMQVAINGT